MNAAAKTILAIALVAVAVIVFLNGNGGMPGYLLGAGATGTEGRTSSGDLGGYLTILMLIDVGLGAVVAWMLFGTPE
jgi:hypothetical protein